MENQSKMGSLYCFHCNKFHPSSEWCNCEKSRQAREDLLHSQLMSVASKEKTNLSDVSEWELFRDSSYFDMFCVRPKGSKKFGVGFHLINEEEASNLCDLLNNKVSVEEKSENIENILGRLRDIHRRNPSEYAEIRSIICLVRGLGKTTYG